MGRFAVAPGQRVQKFSQKAGSIAYASGQTAKLVLPQSDYLTRIDITSAQTITTGATAPVVAGYGAWGPLFQIQINTNGQRHPVSLPGYHLDIYQRVRNSPYGSQLTSAPVTVSSSPAWTTPIEVPLTVEDTQLGAWYTGDTALTMDVRISCGTAAQTFSTVNGATIQGSWDVWREIFNAPAPDQAGGWLNEISYYHEVTLQTSQQLKNGTTQISLPTDQDYERILLIFYTGANTDSTFLPVDGGYTTLDLVLNDKIHIDEVLTEAKVRFDMNRTYHNTLPAGTAVIDKMMLANSRRDVLPTDPSAAQTLKLNIASTSTTFSVDVVTETVSDSPFAGRWVAQAAAKAAAASGAK